VLKKLGKSSKNTNNTNEAAMLTITSENTHFSYLIQKDPNRKELFSRSYRKGIFYGWFNNDQTYKVYFKDSINFNSFSKDSDEFNYLSISSYAHPYLVVALIDKVLRSAYVLGGHTTADGLVVTDDVVRQSATFLINYANEKKLTMIYNSVGITDVKLTKLANRLLEVKVSLEDSLQNFLKRVLLASLTVTLSDFELPTRMQDDVITKYIKICNELNIGYNIRHLISVYMLKQSSYTKHIAQLNTDTIKILEGTSQAHRHEFIKDKLGAGSDIYKLIDFGCGEGYHTLRLADKYKEILAVDKDEELLSDVNRKASYKSIENIAAFTSIDDALKQVGGKCHVLATEVFEHMAITEMHDIIYKIMSNPYVTRLVITLPNKDFNKHYLIEGFRHVDHDGWIEKEFGFWGSSLTQEHINHNKSIKEEWVKVVKDRISKLPPESKITLVYCHG
jgi:cyclopropane fatty-acyl-phospholipid synthase-like methyltransferase